MNTSKELAKLVNAEWTASLNDKVKGRSVVLYRNYIDNDDVCHVNNTSSQMLENGAANVSQNKIKNI